MSYNPIKAICMPNYDARLGKHEKDQVSFDRNMKKRGDLITTRLPKWGKDGALLTTIQEDCNQLTGVNFNRNHMRHILDYVLVGKGVIGRRRVGDDWYYYAFKDTKARWTRLF